jgi:pimeloyl-ACP methyl ester carboxylesterase
LDATVVGGGQVGVVLANQTDNVDCMWSPLPQYLAAHGYRVLAFDYGNGDQSAEVQAAARYLRDQGARRLVLMGASIGGAVVIDAAIHLHPAPAAVVCLSAVPEVTSYPFPSDARRLQSPVFQIGGTEDPVTQEGKDTRALYRASRSPGKRLLLVPGVTHGVDFIGAGGGTRIRRAILAFIQTHAPA